MFTFSVSHQTTCLGYLTNVLHFVTATPTVSMTCFPSSASASSCSSSSTSHLASPPVCSLFLLFLLFLCLHLINEAGLLSVGSFYHVVHAFFLCFYTMYSFSVPAAISCWGSAFACQSSGLTYPGSHWFSPQGLVWRGRQQQELILLWHRWLCHCASSLHQ